MDRLREVVLRPLLVALGNSSGASATLRPVLEVIVKYLKPLTQCVVLWTTRGQSPATRVLGLSRQPTAARRSNRRMYFRLILYTVVSILLPTLYEELKAWYYQQRLIRQQQRRQQQHQQPEEIANEPYSHNNYNNSDSVLQQVAAARQYHTAHWLVETVLRSTPVLQLLVLWSAWTGITQTAEIAMLWTGWTYHRPTTQKSTLTSSPTTTGHPLLHVDYAQRRWTWQEMMRCVQVWGQGWTLLGIWQQDVQRWWCPRQATVGRTVDRHNTKDKAAAVPSSSVPCVYCHTQPMIVPMELQPCGHLACYTCWWYHHRQTPQNNHGATPTVSSRNNNIRCAHCHARVHSVRRPVVTR